MMDFGMKEKNGELFIKTDYTIPPKISQKKAHTKWKLIESLFDLEGDEHLFVVEPKQRTKKISVFANDHNQNTLISPIKRITIAELVRSHDLEILIPQISLAIKMLNQLADESNQINKKTRV